MYEIIKIVLIIFDVFILLALLFAAWRGFKKGVVHTSLVIASRIIPLLLVFFFMKPISKVIINYQLPEGFMGYTESTTLSNIVKSMIADEIFAGNMAELTTTQLDILIDDCLISVVGAILFFVFAILIFLIVSPLIRLIFRLTLPFAKAKEHSGISRAFGAFLGVCSYLIFFVVLVLPIYGAIETSKVIINEVSTYDSSMESVKEELNQSTSSSITLKLTSSIGKNKNGKLGLGAKYLGLNFAIRTSYGNVNLLKELDGIGSYLPRAMELFDIFSKNGQDINQIVDALNVEDIQYLTAFLADSKIIKVAYPTIISLSKVKGDDFAIIKESNLNFDELITIDINKDLAKSKTFLVALLNIAKEIDFNNVNVDVILTNKTIQDNITKALSTAFDLEISQKALSKILISYLNQMLEQNNLVTLVGLIDTDYLKNDLSSDFSSIVEVYNVLDETGIIELYKNSNYTLELTDEDITKLQLSVDKIVGLKLLANEEKKILQTIFEFSDFNSEKIQEMLNEDIDWHQEVENVGELAIQVLKILVETKFKFDDPSLLLDSDKIVDLLTIAINDAFEMQLAEKYFVPLAIQYIDKFLEQSNLSEFVGIIDAEYLKNNFTNDLNKVVESLKTIKELKLLEYFKNKEENPIELNEEFKSSLQDAIDGILSISLVVGNEKVFAQKALSFIPSNLGLDIDAILADQSINWQTEIDKLGEVLQEVIVFVIDTNLDTADLDNLLENDEALDEMPNLIEKLFQLQIAKDYFTPIVMRYLEDMLASTGFEITLTDSDKDAILCNPAIEFKTIADLIKEGLNLFAKDDTGEVNFENRTGAEIAILMKKASEGVVASRVLGGILNDTLGPTGLNILPIDEATGQLSYDFTLQETLFEQADSIAAAFDLAMSLKDLDIDSMTSDDITSIGNQLANLAETNTTLVTEAINSFISTNTDINIEVNETTDWEKEANTLTTVLDAYQNSTDKENFNISDDAALEEMVNDSEFAMALLTYLGLL